MQRSRLASLTGLIALAGILAPTPTHAVRWFVAPTFIDGTPGIAVRGIFGATQSRDVFCGESRNSERNYKTILMASAVGVGTFAYLHDRTRHMDRFNDDLAVTTTAFTITGLVNSRICGNDWLQQTSLAVSSSVVSSLADYERALHYTEGISPLLWSAVQGSSLSVFENALLGRGLFSNLGMDLGPGFASVRFDKKNSESPIDFDFKWRLGTLLGTINYAAHGYHFEVEESLKTGSLVFTSHEPPSNIEGEEVLGYTVGNAYAVYRPASRATGSAQYREDVIYNWAIPAHERTHAGQVQKMDIPFYPLNEWAVESKWFSFLRPGGELGLLLVAAAGLNQEHDDRRQEWLPVSLEEEIERQTF